MGETSKKKPLFSSSNYATRSNNAGTINNCNTDGGTIVKPSNIDIDGEIDEALHCRQLACYGRETMHRLLHSNILISGMQGLGAEIAKNLILAGVKSVTLHDEGIVELWDLSSNFVFSEDDVGKNRANTSLRKLQELNKAVTVSILGGTLTREQLSDFQVVVFTDISLEKAIEFDDHCRSHQPAISFIKTEVGGLFGSVFCDFGPEFIVVDVDGEEARRGVVASISNDYPALVSCADDDPLEFEDGDLVVFSEVKGMTKLNDGNPRRIKNARPDSFKIDEDTKEYRSYKGGGIVTQVKEAKLLHFKSLREELKSPSGFILTDGSKSDRPSLLHLAFQALDRFKCEVGRFPASGSEEDAEKLISLATNLNESLGTVRLTEEDNKLLRYFAFGAKAVLSPMAATFGGIVAQEVVKACTGKFHPILQLLYFDSIESLPSEGVDSNDLKPLNSRYDAQISVFGSKFQRKLEKSKLFMVGAGGLGCELLKNLALMGVSCDTGGKLTVTDDDLIEKSNLSRQFLFRNKDIGKSKSRIAASVAAEINPHLHIEALQMWACYGPKGYCEPPQKFVYSEIEKVFNDTFWDNVDVVVNALDNVPDRFRMDQKCVYYNKPLLESGTYGTKCSTQVVIPHVTENYGALRDTIREELEKLEQVGSKCTIRYYPYKIHHCLMWARSEFEGLFEKTPTEVNDYLSDPIGYERTTMHCITYDFVYMIDCLKTLEKAALLGFEDYFANYVKQLTYTYPENCYADDGLPVWLAPKRFPSALKFTVDDSSHLEFIMAASILRAETCGIPIPEWSKDSSKWVFVVCRVRVPRFKPSEEFIPPFSTQKFHTSIMQAKRNTDYRRLFKVVATVPEMKKKLRDHCRELPHGFVMKTIQFNKDNDKHIRMVTALANLRARNYKIEETDKLKAKIITGKIIPAVATSTAVATGLVSLELYKVIDGGHILTDYRSSCSNLGLPLYNMFQPIRPKLIWRIQGSPLTVWDRWFLTGNPTLRQVFDKLKGSGLSPSGVCHARNTVYVEDDFPTNHHQLLDKRISYIAKYYRGNVPMHNYNTEVIFKNYSPPALSRDDILRRYIDIMVVFRGGYDPELTVSFLRESLIDNDESYTGCEY